MSNAGEFRFDEDVLAQQSWLGDSQLLGGTQVEDWMSRACNTTPSKKQQQSVPTTPVDDATNWTKLLKAALSPTMHAPPPSPPPQKQQRQPDSSSSQSAAKGMSFFQQALSQVEAQSARLRGDSATKAEKTEKTGRIRVRVEAFDAESEHRMVSAGYAKSLELRIPEKRSRGRLASTYRRLNERWSKLSKNSRLVLGSSEKRPGVILYSWEDPVPPPPPPPVAIVEDSPTKLASQKVARLEAELRAAKEELMLQTAAKRRLTTSTAVTAVATKTPPRKSPRRLSSSAGSSNSPPSSNSSRRWSPLHQPQHIRLESVPEDEAAESSWQAQSSSLPLSPGFFDSNIDLPWDASMRSRHPTTPPSRHRNRTPTR